MILSIIIPAYNEEKRIMSTLKGYTSFFKKMLKKDFEIIVVSNNCKDNTLRVVQNFAKNNKSVKILNFPYYTGKGKAVMEGFKIARGDYIGFADADNSTSAENFFLLYKNKRDFDGVIASRRIKGAVIFPKRKLNQEVSSYFFYKFTDLLFNLGFKDTQCGAKLFTKKTADLLVNNYKETGWIFDVELLYICKKNNLKVLEQPIKWEDSEGSHLKFSHQLISPLHLLRFRLRIWD